MTRSVPSALASIGATVLLLAACGRVPSTSASDVGAEVGCDGGGGPGHSGCFDASGHTRPDTPSGLVGLLAIGPPTTSWFEPEFLVGEARWLCAGFLDIDRDGSLEIVLVSTRNVAVLRSVAGGWVRETTPYLPDDVGGSPIACASGDVDGDGFIDLVIANGVSGAVMLNDQAGGFRPVPLPHLPTIPGSPLEPSPMAVALLDVNRDSRLDAYLARSFSGSATTFMADGCVLPDDGDVHCGKPGVEYGGYPDVLLLNEGGGSFTLAPVQGDSPGLQTQALGVLDLDDDGLQDLVVGNDAAFTHVLLNRGDGTFRDATAQMGLDRLSHGMGFATGDLDGDGRTDLIIADIGIPFVAFGTSAGFFTVGRERGFAPVGQWALGTAAEDFDNDGDLDLLFENQLLSDFEVMTFLCADCGFERLPKAEVLMYRNDGKGRFVAEDVAALPSNAAPDGSPEESAGGGGDALAVGDVDGDGVLDALVLRWKAGNRILREAWLLRGRAPNAGAWITVDAPFGAKVEVCVPAGCTTREVASGGSFASLFQPRLHFGLGAAVEANVRVEWPRGATNDLGSAPAESRLVFPPGFAGKKPETP